MVIWDKVIELEPTERAFQVFHKRLKISRDDYLKAAEFPRPFSEQGCQDFVARYLQEKGDNGVVGMVRLEEDDVDIVLDAAVRYPIYPDQQLAEIRTLQGDS